MRTLLLLRGAPGCGKSTFIDENGLRPYALSADEIRLLCQSSQQTVDGKEAISQNNEKTVWKILFELLEIRMQNGEFTVIDAVNSKTAEMKRYKDMCDTYRYRIFCVDFTDLPIEECKRRNLQRTYLKQVPEEAIDKMYSRFRNQKIPSGIKVIKPNELDTIWMKEFDFSDYKKIVHIGDIHGCYTALMEYFKDGLQDDTMYIFVGDLIDRGIENAEVIKWFIENINRKNVLVLEGNHEKSLQIYSHGGISYSKEFELFTKKQLEESHIDLKDIRILYNRFAQCAWYTYDGKHIFVSHGGIATMPENLSKMATIQMIKGVGNYKDCDIIAETWHNTMSPNYYQIYGHRNVKGLPIKVNDNVFNLEGQVEFGGNLRILELTHDGFNEISIKNEVFKALDVVKEQKEIKNNSITDVVMQLRANKFIAEKQFENNISSFNFTKDAFYKKEWDEQTTTARGLYIDTNKMKITARSYEKFFNVNERPETKFDMLKYKLQFPVTCYVKENGFLGLVSYNEYTDDLFITTKSNPDGDAAILLKNMIDKKISKENRDKIKQYCKDNDITFVFECVDMENDPHIIEYPDSELFLLSIVKNNIDFEQYEYPQVQNIGNHLGLKVKELAYEIANWSDFFDWYNEVLQPDYEYNGRKIEGFVIEDSTGFMIKLKLSYYNFWKFMRAVAYATLKTGHFRDTGALTTATANDFYAFCQRLYNSVETKEEREKLPRNIITLRNMFLLNIGDD